jgi:chromosomal replication initiation ATPase DnaA
MALDIDPRFTFDSFVEGPTNREAVEVARRAATPGSRDNPLLICGGSGLGKTHLLNAIGRRAQRLHSVEVAFVTLEHLSDMVSGEGGSGRQSFRSRIAEAGLLLLDDIQLVAGQRPAEEEVLLAWDALDSRGGQVVLTSDRLPEEIDGLDDRLRDRLADGRMVELGPPDYETRIAITQRKAEERGHPMSPGIHEALARIAFSNVRELQGALNRLIAIEDLENRKVRPEEVTALLGAVAAERGEAVAGAGAGAPAEAVTADSRLRDAAEKWRREGFRTRRLDGALEAAGEGAALDSLLRAFEDDIGRLKEIEAEIRAVEPRTADRSTDVLRDPDRRSEAEALLEAVRKRRELPPALPPGPRLQELEGDSLALRAAQAVVAAPGGAYNPLYIVGSAGAGKTTLLVGLGNALQDAHEIVVGYVGAEAFSDELVDALKRNRLEEWRARYRRADALVLDDVDRLAGSERAQEELFRLFEELHRGGRQLVFAARRMPQDLAVPDRLQSRMEGGLVVELEPRRTAPRGPGPARGREPGGSNAGVAGESGEAGSSWLSSREKVLWEWPYAEDWIEESLD